MLFQPPLGKRSMWLMPLMGIFVLLSGCISDPITPFQVRPETVLAPQNPTFRAINYKPYSTPPAGQMFVKWNRSIADTQLNFKGYFVQLYTSNYDSILQIEDLNALLDTASIFHLPGKLTDTFYTFPTIQIPHVPGSPTPIPLGRYTVKVKSLKTSASDTTIYSVDSSIYSAYFDPLPLESPSNLRATSTGRTTVLLRWTDPVTAKDTGFFQYVVYYRDTTLTPFDTGHVAAIVPKYGYGGNDSTVVVNVPAATGSTVTASEYPYEFWVKSERNDSTFFYGADMYGLDTNHITWAGAEAVPVSGNDSANTGYLLVPNDSAIYFGPNNGQYDLAINSTPNTGQVTVSISNGIATLKIQNPNGAGFLPNRIDPANGLDSIFYSTPLATVSQFTADSIQLPQTSSDNGVIVYLMMNDDITPSLKQQWARIFIFKQPGGGFISTNVPGGGIGIDMKGSFQPGTTKDGSAHLPYY